MDQDLLNWRVEAACLSAWPGLVEVERGGWLLRASGGTTRRPNAANPLRADALMDEALIEGVEAFYAGHGMPTYFRVPDIAGAIDPVLEKRGYVLEGRTHTLFCDLADLAATGEGVTIATTASDAWLDARDAISGSTPDAAASARAIMAKIGLTCAYVSVVREGRIVSLLLGVQVGDLVIPESVMTDPAWRGQRLAGRCIAGLAQWALGQGGRALALQVDASNAAGLAAYRRMGLTRELYSYHYRVKC